VTYVVQSGDTMYLIAQKFGVPLQALIAANPQIADPNLIYPGQTLMVPAAAPSPSMTYVVKSGDTMYLIAQKFGIPLQALIAANPQITDPSLIYPGQVLMIPAAPSPGPSPRPSPMPMPGWCTLVLTPLHPKVDPGSVLCRQSPPHIMIATMDMPDPSMWTDCDVYTAWLMDDAWTMDGGGGMVMAWFDLFPVMRKGFWINHADPKALSMREHVLVTAEDMGHPARPTGMKMLHGHLRHCCHHDDP